MCSAFVQVLAWACCLAVGQIAFAACHLPSLAPSFLCLHAGRKRLRYRTDVIVLREKMHCAALPSVHAAQLMQLNLTHSASK